MLQKSNNDEIGCCYLSLNKCNVAMLLSTVPPKLTVNSSWTGICTKYVNMYMFIYINIYIFLYIYMKEMDMYEVLDIHVYAYI